MPRPALQWVLDGISPPAIIRNGRMDLLATNHLGRALHASLHDLVGELSTRSEEFRRRWSSHNVRLHGAGVKHFHHTLVGNLKLAYESVDMISDPGLTLTIYAAEPASPTAQALDLLASWTSSPTTRTDTASGTNPR